MVRLVVNSPPANTDEILSTAKHARCCAAHLNMHFPADGGKLKHSVEGRDFIDPDKAHLEQLGHVFDRRPRNPSADLLLRPPEDGDHRGRLAAHGVIRDDRLSPFEVLRGEGEAFRLDIVETAHAHRSTSPKTISIEPRMAETSASIWPRHMKSMACKCAKPGARSLQR